MRLPKVHGTIKRRLLVNFPIDPEVMQRHLPAPFRMAHRFWWRHRYEGRYGRAVSSSASPPTR